MLNIMQNVIVFEPMKLLDLLRLLFFKIHEIYEMGIAVKSVIPIFLRSKIFI